MSPSLIFLLVGAVAAALGPVLGVFLQMNQNGANILRSACTIKNISGTIGTRPLLCAFFNFDTAGVNGTAIANTTAARPRYACVDFASQTDAVAYACNAATDTCVQAYSSLDPTATLLPGADCATLNPTCSGYFVCEENTVNGVTSIQCPQEFIDNALTGVQGICVLVPTNATVP